MDNKFFDQQELELIQATPKEKSGSLVEAFTTIHCQKVNSIKAIVGNIPIPGSIYFLWTVKSFNAFTFIPYIIKECGPIQEIVLSTYSINIRIVNSLVRYMEKGEIGEVTIFISETIKSRLSKVNDHLSALTERYPVKIIYGWNHSKISLIKTGDHFFVVEGSGNYSENAQHEQYIFLDNEKVFSFRKNEILYGIK